MSKKNAKKSSHKPRRAKRKASEMAEAARYTGKGSYGTPEGDTGPGRPVHGVRERSGEYGPPQDPSKEKEDVGGVGSTRLFETDEGKLTYSQVSERIAVELTGILHEILDIPPDQIVITPEWICLRHQALAGSMFPQWAGRFRDVNVRVGAHTPPPFYEVPGLVRLFCDDLTERLCHIRPRESAADDIARLLAWSDWRFQWIHPFKDFNGRIGRALLATVLYKLALPHVETAPLEQEARRRYLDALLAADHDNLSPLTDVWVHRLAEAV